MVRMRFDEGGNFALRIFAFSSGTISLRTSSRITIGFSSEKTTFTPFFNTLFTKLRTNDFRNLDLYVF